MTIWERFLQIFRRNKRETNIVVLAYDPIQVSLEKDIGKNIEAIQSYILTAVKYNFSEYEKKILSRLVECFQLQLKGQDLGAGFFITQSQQGDVDIVLPISSLVAGEDLEANHEQLEKALYSLLNRKVNYKDKGVWTSIGLIERPEINDENRNLQFRLHYRVREALMSFSSGYRKQELDSVMSFRSTYAQRFHELLKNTNVPVRYSIDELKAMFQLENRYKQVKLFVTRVIEQAKKELDVKSPFSFTYQLEYEKYCSNPKGGRKRIIAIIFTPTYPSDQHLKKQGKNDQPKSGTISSVSNQITKRKLKQSTGKRNTTDKQRASVQYFLKEILGLTSGKELKKLTDLTVVKGGSKYLTTLFRTCNGDVDATIEKLRKLKSDTPSTPISETTKAAEE